MVEIKELNKEYIVFCSEEVLYKPCIAVWLPAMPSFPEGYKINIYGDLERQTDGGALILTNIRTIDPTDLTIYHAFVDYLEQEKKNEEIAASLHSALVAMVESHAILGDKIKELHDSVKGTKELLKLKNKSSTTIH